LLLKEATKDVELGFLNSVTLTEIIIERPRSFETQKTIYFLWAKGLSGNFQYFVNQRNPSQQSLLDSDGFIKEELRPLL